MKSITEIYKQGMGPSSTLNMVPYQACMDVAKEIRIKRCKVNHVEINLYNEYARLENEAGITNDIDFAFVYSNFKYSVTTDKPCPPACKDEPYVFDIVVYATATEPAFRHRVVADGGANYHYMDSKRHDAIPYKTFAEVQKWFKDHPKASFMDFAKQADDPEAIKSIFYRGINLAEIACLQGLRKRGEVRARNANIHYARQARNIWLHDDNQLSEAENANRIISAFSYAISEEIVEKRVIVAAPSVCTTSILWSVLLYLENLGEYSTEKLIEGFVAAGIFASLVDAGASLAPIDVGCQGPMGAACGMAAVVLAVVMYNANIDECGRAFEMALEHTLGVICDASTSLPIIPCIQRCSAYATRAFEIAVLNHSLMTTPELCKLDDLIKVISETGGDLIAKNRRLGVGGFAEHAKYSLQKPTAKDWE